MKNSVIHLAKDFTIPSRDYASQANAILGIREAGKTYTATKAAEELMDAGIPVIVYDPPGIWKNLKTGTGKHKGYPIVTAGGTGSDIRLTPANACDVVRAAMKENVNLIIDLMSPELINKATWIKIVQETADLLMYENMHYGLRHIFLEEAAEFIPQKVQPQQSRVYASLERVARMGRNVGLGMTVVNQRAEEINKAILEICTFCLIHKQVGKNSLNSIKKWLEIREIPNALEVIKSLPLLNHGEAWAIGISDLPRKVQILPKKTFHPNPKKEKNSMAPKPTADVGPFVQRMNKQLENEKAAAAVELQTVKQLRDEVNRLKSELSAAVKGQPKQDPAVLQENKKLRDHLAKANSVNDALARKIVQQASQFEKIKSLLHSQCQSLMSLGDSHQPIEEAGTPAVIAARKMQDAKVYTPSDALKTAYKEGFEKPAAKSGLTGSADSSLPAGEKIILTACGQMVNGCTRQQLTVLAGYKRSSRDAYILRLKNKNYLTENGERLICTEEGFNALGDNFTKLPTGSDLAAYWLTKLPKGEREILEILIEKYPDAVAKDDITEVTGSKRSSRDAYLLRLAAKELVVNDRGTAKAADILFDQL